MTLDKDTLMPIGLTGAIILATVSGMFWLNGKFADLDKRMTRIEALLVSQWTIDQQELWAERLGRTNPTLNVPPVRRP